MPKKENRSLWSYRRFRRCQELVLVSL